MTPFLYRVTMSGMNLVEVFEEIRDDSALSATEKSILWTFVSHADHRGMTSPGVDLVAEGSGYSRRQVQRVVKDLAEKGYLHLVGPSRGGRGNTNTFCVGLQFFTPEIEQVS